MTHSGTGKLRVRFVNFEGEAVAVTHLSALPDRRDKVVINDRWYTVSDITWNIIAPYLAEDGNVSVTIRLGRY